MTKFNYLMLSVRVGDLVVEMLIDERLILSKIMKTVSSVALGTKKMIEN